MDSVVVGLLIFMGFCIFMFFITSKNVNKAKKDHDYKLKDKDASLFVAINHFQGLPIAENTLCQIYSSPNEYEFIANGNSFKLSKNKVTDISINSDVEIQKSHSSSIGGAVGGAILFGPIGAAIGGRSREKTSRIVNNYLIFTYKNDNEIKYIAFDATNSYLQANKFIIEFNKNNISRENNIVQL